MNALRLFLTVVALVASTGALRAQFSFTPSPVSSAANPIILNVGQNYPSAASFSIIFNQAGGTIVRIEVGGTVPPGLTLAGSTLEGGRLVITNRPNGVIQGTPTTPGNYVVTVVGASQIVRSDSQGAPWEIHFRVVASGTAPAITTQPASQTVTAGANVTFTAAADGSPEPTFQWRKDGTAISGATSATLTLSSVSAASAGAYSVVATNTVGSATSNAATLTVNAAVVTVAPALTAQPQSVTAAPGGTVALAVVATGTPAPGYQWRKDTVALAGATDATLVLSAVTAASAGAYSVIVSNSAGNATSSAGTLTVAAGTGRLANLSVRANLGLAQTLIVGFATNGAKSVLLRGIGPTLGAFGVSGAYTDPRLELYNAASTKINENDDWAAALAPAFSAVAAFPLTAASKDAALQATVSGAHSAHLKGPNSGVVLVELYDSGTGTAVRLVNVSARNLVGSGDNIMIAGFVVDGTVAKTLLIRAIGPTLASFGVDGTLADPKLEIYNSSAAKIVENDNWSGALSSTFSGVGAFPLLVNSRDAALLVTLMPGSYSAQVSGIANGTGEALVEVYEVP